MRYENEKCCFCGESFKNGDKIVVCPECGAPHHKSCYEINSKCAFDNLHSEGYVWTGNYTAQEDTAFQSRTRQTKFCPVCQAENSADAEYCENCKAPFLVTQQQTDAEKINIDGEYVSSEEYIDIENTVKVGEAAVYIKSNSQKYLKTYLKAKYSKSRPKFNFAAFFLSPYWFFYRKMYLPGILFAGTTMAASLFFMSLVRRCFPEATAYLSAAAEQGISDMTDLMQNYQKYIQTGMQQHPALYRAICFFPLVFILINLIAGFTANRLYLNKIKKDVLKIRSISPNKDTLYAYLYAKGGTSILVVVAAFFLIDTLSQMLFMI